MRQKFYKRKIYFNMTVPIPKEIRERVGLNPATRLKMFVFWRPLEKKNLYNIEFKMGGR